MDAVGPRLLAALSALAGGSSLFAFGLFLWVGSWEVVRLSLGLAPLLAWDAALSLAFFLQHSVMTRVTFRERFVRVLPSAYHGAVYSLASGVVLLMLLVLWQRSPVVVVSLVGPARLVPRGFFVAAVAGIAWGLWSLGSFDTFGLGALRSHLRGTPTPEPALQVRGPYRHVRHPIYSLMLVMIWACPDVSADRLLFNLLWTGWIVLGATLEERDMVRCYGESYRRYQHEVPMLVPRLRTHRG